MKKIDHEWQHEMFEIYGAAIEELLRKLRTEVADSVLLNLTRRVDDLRVKYKKRDQLDAETWLRRGLGK